MAFKFNAEVRTAQGKGASRRLRNNGQIPAIVLWWQRRGPFQSS
ncbi:50S ribosomal protein L25 [Haemophilus influenzae]|uniref:50S ribosomal protein L25 n=1 Tax=Haemophilus influenzae TaxID=727 RepID=A0A2X1Q194_HAEIF|nr:50S ribosomal protein L25 [Haemophilus influenzae]